MKSGVVDCIRCSIENFSPVGYGAFSASLRVFLTRRYVVWETP